MMGSPVNSAPHILDAGCGGGHSFAMLRENFHAARITGVEISPRLVEQSRLAARTCDCPVDIHEGSVEDLQLGDMSTDIIFCHQTIHHLVKPERALAEFFRVLRPGGVLLLSESCRNFIETLPVRILFRHPSARARDAGEFLELVGGSGFVWTGDCISMPEPFWSQPIFGLLARFRRIPAGYIPKPLLNLVARRPLLPADELPN